MSAHPVAAMSKTTLQQAMQMAGGSWPSAWEMDTHEALAVLAARVRVLETELHNAMRLANAAPDLLAALEQFVRASDQFVRDTGLKHGDLITDAADNARAAIRKARGGSMSHRDSAEQARNTAALPPGLERLYRAALPFVKLLKGTDGRIPTERLSFADWHELAKAYDECSPPYERSEQRPTASGKGEA